MEGLPRTIPSGGCAFARRPKRSGPAGSAPRASRRPRTAQRRGRCRGCRRPRRSCSAGRRRGRGCMRSGGRSTIPPATGCATGSGWTATPSTTGALRGAADGLLLPRLRRQGRRPAAAAGLRRDLARPSAGGDAGGAADAPHRRLCPALAPRRARGRHRDGAGWRDAPPGVLPLPHPSWRNTGWLKRNPWFEAELVPELRRRVAGAARGGSVAGGAVDDVAGTAGRPRRGGCCAAMASEAVSGRVSEATCGVTVTRGCAQ